jgi:NADH-quinone oxidoreductase subunit E
LVEQIAEILNPYEGERGTLIHALQKVKESCGYLSRETVSQIAKSLRVSESEIFGVASFYAQFRFTRPGEHSVKVCLGTACHVRGGVRILETLQRELGIEPGGTTEDYKFNLERVACFGSCALAPVAVIDDKVYGRVTTTKAKEILDQYR